MIIAVGGGKHSNQPKWVVGRKWCKFVASSAHVNVSAFGDHLQPLLVTHFECDRTRFVNANED